MFRESPYPGHFKAKQKEESAMKGSCTRGNYDDPAHPCIWMQAGVVKRKLCRADYDCHTCRYDRVMRQMAEENCLLNLIERKARGRRGQIVPWRDKLMARPASQRPCIHHMKDRIEFRICSNEYRCGNCDFDQYFHDQWMVHVQMSPVVMQDVRGFKVPQGYYFHLGHAWLRVEEGATVKVGLDDFALRLLGPFDRIEAPLMGKPVQQGRADIRVYRGENQAKVLSPVSGVVTAINATLRESGASASSRPYSEGWVMTVHTDNLRRDLQNLMILDESRAFIEDEVGRLYQHIEDVAGPLATDGGQLAEDIFGNLPALKWEKLVSLFLRK